LKTYSEGSECGLLFISSALQILCARLIMNKESGCRSGPVGWGREEMWSGGRARESRRIVEEYDDKLVLPPSHD
jgi:hypothetical protein